MFLLPLCRWARWHPGRMRAKAGRRSAMGLAMIDSRDMLQLVYTRCIQARGCVGHCQSPVGACYVRRIRLKSAASPSAPRRKKDWKDRGRHRQGSSHYPCRSENNIDEGCQRRGAASHGRPVLRIGEATLPCRAERQCHCNRLRGSCRRVSMAGDPFSGGTVRIGDWRRGCCFFPLPVQ